MSLPLRVGLLALVLAPAACRDRASGILSPDSSTRRTVNERTKPWRAYDADIVVEHSGTQLHEKRSHRYHISRRTEGRAWATQMDLVVTPGEGMAGGRSRQSLKALIYDTRGVVTAMKEDGRQVNLSLSLDSVETATGGHEADRHSGRADAYAARAFVEGGVTSAEKYAVMVAALTRQMGPPQSLSTGNLSFVRVSHDSTFTIELDPHSSDVAHVTVQARGAVVIALSYEHAVLADGNGYRTGAHLVKRRADGVIVSVDNMSMTNLILSREGLDHVVRSK